MSEIVISIRNVSKSYKNNSVIKDLSINFEAGKSYGIMGQNGSGKSVLLKLIAGFAFPDTGTISIKSKIKKKDMDFIENAGVVINAPEFMNSMTAFNNLKYLAEIKNTIGNEEIIRILKDFRLYDFRNKKVSTFSQGMKQRLRLAQALMESPEILLLDEPMNALDKEGVFLTKEILNAHVAQGKTLIFTSHNKDDFDDLAEEKLEIDNGVLSQVF